jgi:CheY-like chemotaxis protein
MKCKPRRRRESSERIDMSMACSSCRIILAEDNPADVRLVRQALLEHAVDCELRVISDGEEVMTLIRDLDQNPGLPCPDLLLLDLHLPKRDGKEILRHLRASERCGQTPVVVLTSSDSPSDRSDAEHNAAIHYFRKPSALGEFMDLGIIIRAAIKHFQSG